MHRKWVVNASPLIVLGRINHLFLLQHLAEEIVVPTGVAKEIARGPEDDPAGDGCKLRDKLWFGRCRWFLQ